MKIFDLTRGKYSNVYSPQDDLYYVERMEQMSHLGFGFMSVFASSNIDVSKLLNDVPVFLVESSMANEYMAVPECHCSVCIPADKSYSLIDDFDMDNWANSKEGYKDDPRERTSKGLSITDLLGVYVYSGEHDLIPRRVFIWMNKILDYAKEYTKNKGEIIENARALFDLVLYHEMAHALMDVELYGVHPAPNFSYANDYPYRFIEEAYANGIALTILLDKKSYTSFGQKRFIEAFIEKQGEGYSDGWEIYELVFNETEVNLDQWMGLKVIFNYESALVLRDWWEFKEYDNLRFYETVGRNGWIAVMDRCREWRIIELPSQKMVTGFSFPDWQAVEAYLDRK